MSAVEYDATTDHTAGVQAQINRLPAVDRIMVDTYATAMRQAMEESEETKMHVGLAVTLIYTEICAAMRADIKESGH